MLAKLVKWNVKIIKITSYFYQFFFLHLIFIILDLLFFFSQKFRKGGWLSWKWQKVFVDKLIFQQLNVDRYNVSATIGYNSCILPYLSFHKWLSLEPPFLPHFVVSLICFCIPHPQGRSQWLFERSLQMAAFYVVLLMHTHLSTMAENRFVGLIFCFYQASCHEPIAHTGLYIFPSYITCTDAVLHTDNTAKCWSAKSPM